jgi:predicted ATPase
VPHHQRTSDAPPSAILTPDQRLRVFVSSTLQELAPERAAARRAIESLQLVPVLFELGARPHPPEMLYRAYLGQSHVFVGIYWESYGWMPPGNEVSGIDHEYRLSTGMPRLLYVKEPAPDRGPSMTAFLERLIVDGSASFTTFANADELEELLRRDLALLITERFRRTKPPSRALGPPTPPTSFVGRDAELAEVERLLVDNGARLLTLTGPGGIGKTRVAIEAARRLGDRFADGVAFVPLEGIRDEAVVQAAVASAVGARDIGADSIAGLCTTLRERELLLVVDNFEQVIGAAPLVTTLLEACPGLTILVTSRELLHLGGEHELRVPPLPAEEEAVVLFVERAAAARHAFELADEDVPLIAEICRRLDGVPLAIELAAPRLRLLSVEQLLDGLSRRLALAGPRDAPARQRTLEAAIAWSYELLGTDERRMFQRLGVFRGSFTLDAAAAVCELEGDPLDLLASLLDKSIVYRLADSGEPRFTMLTMIRDYALDRLHEAGGLDATMERLAAFHLDLARDAEVGLRSVDQRTWRRVLDFEVDNVRATLAWLADRKRVAELAVLLRGFWLYWWLRGHFDECRGWLRGVLETGERVEPGDYGWVVAVDGLFAFFQGDFPTATAELEAAAVQLQTVDDRLGLALIRAILSIVTAATGDYDRAQAQITDCIAEFEEIGDAWGMAQSQSTSCWLRAVYGRYEGSGDAFERALAAVEEIGDELAIAMALSNLATKNIHEGDLEGTRAPVERLIALLDSTGIVFTRPDVLEILAQLAVLEHLPELAAERLGGSEALREEMQVRLWGPAVERRDLLAEELRAALGDERFEAARSRGRTARFEDLTPAPELPVRRRVRGRARSRA